MMKLTKKGRMAKVAALGAVLTVGATALLTSTTGPASADPPEYNAYVGVGSDTTQDVMNALAGYNQGTTYNQVFSDTGTPRSTIASFDALPSLTNPAADGCITTKLKAGSFARPNGSGSGQRALSRSLDSGTFGPTPATNFTQCSEPGKAITNLVDFARSSSGPSGGAGTAMVFVPFARDALSFGYAPGPTFGTLDPAYTSIPKDVLQAAYANTTPATSPTTYDPDGAGPLAAKKILPCGIQDKSGTYSTWNGNMGLPAPTSPATLQTTEDAASSVCRALNTATDDDANGRIQENFGLGLVDKAAASASTPNSDALFIVGFSASNFVSQFNGTVTSNLSTMALGSIDFDNAAGPNAAVAPVTISGSVATSNAAFFNLAGGFGRDVYNVLPYGRMLNAGTLGMKELFISNPTGTALGAGQLGRGLPANFTAVICRTGAGTAGETIAKFGFLPASSCGSTTLTAASRSGAF